MTRLDITASVLASISSDNQDPAPIAQALAALSTAAQENAIQPVSAIQKEIRVLLEALNLAAERILALEAQLATVESFESPMLVSRQSRALAERGFVRIDSPRRSDAQPNDAQPGE